MFPFKQKAVGKNTIIRVFSEDVDPGDLVWHRDRNDRLVEVLSGKNWYIQLENRLPQKLSEGSKISIGAGEYHRVIKGEGDLMVKIYENKELSPKQKKIARAADPKNKITAADFEALRSQKGTDEDVDLEDADLFQDESVYEEFLLESLSLILEKKKRKKRKKKKKTDFHKGGESSYRKGRSNKQLSKQISLTRAYNNAKTEKQKQKIRDKIDRSREKERSNESSLVKIDLDILKEYIEEIVEEQKLYAALEEAAAIEEADDDILYELEDLDEKRKRKKKKKKKKKSGSRTLSKAVKKSLDKKADKRCLTRGSVYAEFRAGLGAYYSSGSRKGMSAHQWAHARVNSANPSKSWAKVKKRKSCPKKKKK